MLGDAFAVAGASGGVSLESATGLAAVVSSVDLSTTTSPWAKVSPHAVAPLPDFIEESLPPVVNTIPGGACRTDTFVDAEVPDFGASTTPDPGVESPSV
jgi:hypothetical protein